MEINFSKNEIKSTQRAWKIIEEINTKGDLLTDEDISSKISIYSHKNYPYGSLLIFAIMMEEYKTALFLVEHGITISESDEEIARAISESSEDYNEEIVGDKLDRLSMVIENGNDDQCGTYRKIYEYEKTKLDSYMKLKELYPVKKRVRE